MSSAAESLLSADLLTQLQESLSASYTIVRELGGGGMSRVFLAEDLALHRAVVIKVLHPELAAGVNAERFNREVLLSARLQHPHIVPVLTAGSVGGLPYYVMPFVKGDSLRARIAAGPMAFTEVSEILGDVSKALAYAHEEGVVHRDIKPDNILLSGGAATVADFGIAKALSSARQDSEGLTTLGMSLGTPAYMAPEQVAGDPDTDHRADIYSLGCVAYEMLTGQSPFAGKSPQQLLAAQVMETPVPVSTRRPGVPNALAALVMRCLEKEPSKRPQSATEIAKPLEAASAVAPAAASKRSAKGLVLWAIAGVFVIAAAVAVPALRRDKSVAPPSDTINLAVAPFEVLDPQLALWREGIVDVLSRNLDGAGTLRALSPSVTIKGWEGHAERTAAVAFAKRVGAQLVMYGQLQPAGAGLVSAKVWILDAERGTAPVEVEVRDSVARMDRVTDSLSFRSLAAIGRMRTIGAAKLASLGSNSLPAIRAFLQGAQHFRRTQFDSAAISLREAVTADSTFGIAYAMLGMSYGWTGDGSRLQWDAFGKAGQQIRPGLSPHDSLTLVAIRHYALANENRGAAPAEMKKAFAAAAAVTDRYPDDPAAWYLLGDMRFHHDREITEPDAFANFDRAIRADSDFAPAYIHAIELAYRQGPAAGSRLATAYAERSRPGQQRDGINLALTMASGSVAPSALRALLDTVKPNVAGSAFTALRRMPDSAEVALEVLRAAVRRNPGNTGDSFRMRLAEALGFRGHIAESWKYTLEVPSYNAAELSALGLIPADSAARVLRPWLDKRNDASLAAVPALAAVGDTATINKIVASATQMAKVDTNATRRAAMLYFAASSRAYSALARRDTAAATPLFDALSDTSFLFPVDQFIRARLVARSDPRRAMTILERMPPVADVLYPARQLERARIAERLGEREKAVDAYAFVAAAWRNTDSELLRNAVNEAKTALARLDGDGRMRAALSEAERR